MKADVTLRFDKAIREKFPNQEIQNFLLKHDRKQICIDKLCDQILRAERYTIIIRVETYATIIKDIALMFAKACLSKVEQDHYSAAEISRIKRKQDTLKEANELLKDLEEQTLHDKSLTEIERSEIKRSIEIRQAGTANEI